MTHPKQRSRGVVTLPAIAGVEMWERFSFYGMQAILVYYIYNSLGMEQAHATALVGAYGSMLYLFTFVGGWVSDRILGAERTLVTGAALLICGHLALSTIPGMIGLFCGLLPLALGSGLLKTAAITILGAAFPVEAGKRDGAFQIFYLGINIGALFGPMLTGWLAQRYNYHIGFLAAAILMAVGCLWYGSMRKRILTPEIQTPAHPLPRHLIPAVLIGGVVVIIALGACLTLAPNFMAMALLGLTVAAAVLLFATMLRSPLVTISERHKVLAFVPLFVCSSTYWALQAQTYGVFAVYSDQRLNRMVGPFEIPASWTQSLNPFYILVFSLPLAALLARKAPARQVLMGGGIIVAGLGMFLLLPYVGGAANSTPFLVLAGAILAMSLGELFIGPIGMAASAAHAPKAFATRFSALYFLTMAIGTSLAGTLSTFYDASSAPKETLYLCIVGGVPIVLGIILLVTSTAGRGRRAEGEQGDTPRTVEAADA